MHGSPKKNDLEADDHHSYTSHSGGKGHCNRGYACSAETESGDDDALCRRHPRTPRMPNGEASLVPKDNANYPISAAQPDADDSLYRNSNMPPSLPDDTGVANLTNEANVLTQDIILSRETEKIFMGKISKRQSRGVQAWPTPPYRLKIIPRALGKSNFGFHAIRRWIFCQLGLGSLLFIWILMGATAFRYTEGPWEEQIAQELSTKQKKLVTGLADELKQHIYETSNSYSIIEKYMYLHEQILAEGSTGLSQGTGGHIWTFPGCILFAVSLITTLGFGAPVPRTPEGRGVVVIFAAFGIPLHLLLVLNVGMAIAIRLQSYAQRKKRSDEESHSDEISSTEDNILEPYQCNGIFSISRHKRSGSEPIGRQAMNNIATQAADIKAANNKKDLVSNIRFKTTTVDKDVHLPQTIPHWLKWLPFVFIFTYYLIGFLLFGVARYKSFLESLMFPLDFTVAGGVAHTEGYIRILYAVYLQGTVVIVATTVSILQVSATQGLTDLGLKYGLLTNSR